MEKHYPEETFKAIVAILFDIKLIAQRKIKSDGHIVTSRLRNSLFVKTIKQKFANRATNKRGYSFQGGSSDRDLSVNLKNQQGAVGTNVIYGNKIEKLDSYLEHAARTVDVNKRFREIPGRANKKIK
jgi:hypothetical protein